MLMGMLARSSTAVSISVAVLPALRPARPKNRQCRWRLLQWLLGIAYGKPQIVMGVETHRD